MNDIQKQIDELTEGVWHTARLGQLYSEKEIKEGFKEQLKPLLEKVANDAFYAGIIRQQYQNEEPGFHEWWEQQDLIFNEE